MLDTVARSRRERWDYLSSCRTRGSQITTGQDVSCQLRVLVSGAIARLKTGENLLGMALISSDPGQRAVAEALVLELVIRCHGHNMHVFLTLYPCFAEPILHRINCQLHCSRTEQPGNLKLECSQFLDERG